MKVEASFVPSLLLVAFIVLKLTGVITWSWWWVLSPLWIPLALSLALFGVAVLAAGGWAAYAKKQREERFRRALREVSRG